ncbi:MAG: DUF2158 domain-containing protein [Bacteroidales bacterium]|nr:DUF2158 domain-containing protein [Bacteroidales bacterium]
MTNLFKNGDIVCLKSGGPKMTVMEESKIDGDMVRCIWFDEENNKLSGYFEPNTLVKL